MYSLKYTPMKHLLLLLLTTATPILLSAQEEFSFLQQNLQWVEEYFYSDDVNGSTRSYLQYNVAGDTLIDGINYRKVMSDNQFQGGLRETPGMLHLYENGVETTVLDFTLSVGDTIFTAGCRENPPPNGCEYLYPESIDSVEVLDGSLRKRLNFELFLPYSFSEPYFSVSWIDGIGSTWGLHLFDDCDVIGGQRSASPVCGQRLTCVQDNERLLFNNTEDQIWECSERAIVSSIPDNQLPESSLKVLPNPTFSNISIEVVPALQLTRLRLQDLTGRVLVDRPITIPSSTQVMSLTGLPPGVYIMTAYTQEGKWRAVRVVKQ